MMIDVEREVDAPWLKQGWRYEEERKPKSPSRVQAWQQRVGEVTGQYPLAFVIGAVLVGAVAGCLIKRR